MKRILLTLSIIATLGLGANAQNMTNTKTDGFFSSNVPGGQYRESSIDIFPAHPQSELYQDQNAPVGSGLLLLAGMGIAYALRRKQS